MQCQKEIFGITIKLAPVAHSSVLSRKYSSMNRAARNIVRVNNAFNRLTAEIDRLSDAPHYNVPCSYVAIYRDNAVKYWMDVRTAIVLAICDYSKTFMPDDDGLGIPYELAREMDIDEFAANYIKEDIQPLETFPALACIA